MSYNAWVKCNDNKYLSRINTLIRGEIEKVVAYDFPDLKGRWELIQGHIQLRDALSPAENNKRPEHLERAIEHYKKGFPLIAYRAAGSHGAHALKKEFDKFRQLFKRNYSRAFQS